jgi:hypothetical protein
MKKSRKVKRKNTMRLRNKQRGKRRTNKRRTNKRRTKKRRTKKYKQRGGTKRTPINMEQLQAEEERTLDLANYVLCDQSNVNPTDGTELGDRICIYSTVSAEAPMGETSQCCDFAGNSIPIYHFDSSQNTFSFDESYPSGQLTSDVVGSYNFIYAVREDEPGRIYYQLANYGGLYLWSGQELVDCGTNEKRMFNHPCVSHGHDVICAGHLYLNPLEKYVIIDRRSGHYKPHHSNLVHVERILRENLPEEWNITMDESLDDTPYAGPPPIISTLESISKLLNLVSNEPLDDTKIQTLIKNDEELSKFFDLHRGSGFSKMKIMKVITKYKSEL